MAGWAELSPESLVAAPGLIEGALCRPTDGQPQLAKDVDYAKAVLDAWRRDEGSGDAAWGAEWRRCTYHTSDDERTPLYGHLIRRRRSSQDLAQQLPGVIMFHTAAGPHDVFLLYKAASLVGRHDCVALVADVLSDDTGFGWSPDRSRYNEQRAVLLEERGRPTLKRRVEAAIQTLQGVPQVASDRLAVMGWCLGGHPVLEVAKLQHPAVRALATFHGVFDGAEADGAWPADPDKTPAAAEALVCNGARDPFVRSDTLERALGMLRALRYQTSLLQLDAKHGFTNPAQDFNDNPAFAFQSEAAEESWGQALEMLKRTLYD